MANIFISHSSKDNDSALKILSSLQKVGSSIFLDFDSKHGLKGGQKWEKELYVRVKKSRIMIVALSPNWLDSTWCYKEYCMARVLRKKIIPVIIEEDERIEKWDGNDIQHYDTIVDIDAIKKLKERVKKLTHSDVAKLYNIEKLDSSFPGLRSFNKDEAGIFHGRNEDILNSVDMLNGMIDSNEKFLNIIGASGVGKSSFLKAGILPFVELLHTDLWYILPIFRAKQELLLNLAKVLASASNRKSSEVLSILRGSEFIELFEEIELNAFDSAKEKNEDIENIKILLPIDQAEELLAATNKKERDLLINILKFLMEEKSNFYLVWTLRADYLKKYQDDKSLEFVHQLESTLLLKPISSKEIKNIIQEPAFSADILIDEAVVEEIKENISSTLSLPILAYLLQTLFRTAKNENRKRITLNDYNALSKDGKNPIENIINESANAICDKTEDIESIKDLFLTYLVKVNIDESITKQSAKLNNVPENMHYMIEQFVDKRLFIKDRDEEGYITIEIAHEALIYTWEKLIGWIEVEREFLIFKSHLNLYYNEWINANRDDKALLSGLSLEKAINFKDKLKNRDETEFVDKSIIYSEEQEKKFEDLYNKAQEEVVKAKHNIGLVFVEKANKAYGEKDFSKAVGYSYGALENLNSRLDETEARMIVKKTLINSPFYKIAVSIDTRHSCIDISEDQGLIVTGNANGDIKLWSLFDGSYIDTFSGLNETVAYVTLIQNATKIISTSLNGIIQVWDVKKKILLCTISDRLIVYPEFLVSNDETKIIYSSEDFVFVKNIENGQLIDKYVLKDFSSYQSFMYDEKNIFMYSGDTVKLFDITTGEIKDLKETYEWVEEHGVIRQIKHSNGSFKNMKDNIIITLTKDKEKIIALNNSNTIQVWDIKTRDETYVYFLEKSNIGGKIIDFYIMNSTRNVVLYTSDGSITLWKWDGTLINRIMHGNGSDQNFGELFVTKDEKTLIVSNYKKTINIFDLSSTKDFVHEISIKDKVLSLTYSTADTSLYLNTNYTNSNLIDLNNNKVLHNHDQSDPVMLLDTNIKIIENNSCEELPNDTLQVINIETNEILGILSHEDMLFDYILSDDKKILISSSLDETIKVWDMENYALIRTITIDLEHNLVLTKDNKYIFSTSSEYSICKWDIEKGEQILWTLEGQIKSLALSTDNTKIVSVTNDKLKIWNAYNLELLYEMSINKSQGDRVALLDNNILALYSKSDNLIEIIDIEQLEHLNNKDYIDYTSSLYQEKSLMSVRGIELFSWSKWTTEALWSKNHPFHWIDKAENGDTEAMYKLGLIYDKDNENDKALEWYKKAQGVGSIEAKERIEFLEKWMKINELKSGEIEK